MRNQLAMGVAIVMIATVAQAEGWRFSAGPAWRSRVKTEVTGNTPVPTTLGWTERTDPASDPGDYDSATKVEKPDTDNIGSGDTLWAVGTSFTETTYTPGDGLARFGSDDTDGALGLSVGFGRDVWEIGPVSVGLDLRFAGYWNLRSSASGYADGGTLSTRTGTDWWVFRGGPFPGDSDFTHAPPPERDDRLDPEFGAPTQTAVPGQMVRSHLKADLYQIGLGPTVTWRVCPWFSAYAGVEALLNLVSLDFEANGRSASQTDCLLGFGGHFGVEARLTENIGLYGQVGYEWVDESNISANGVKANADFSSLVVSAGIRFHF